MFRLNSALLTIILFGSASIFSVLIFAVPSFAAEENSKSEFVDGKLYGQTFVVSNYVEKGLTQTDSGPAIQAEVGYKWTQARIGLWASNVKFLNASDTIVMRPFVNYRFLFTDNAHLTLRLDTAKYFNDGSRNGNIFSADLEMFTYHVLYEKVENWEGTDYDNQRIGAKKEFNFYDKFNLNLGAGYNKVDADGHAHYFDARVGINYPYDALKFEVAGTATSNNSEFGSRAGPFLIVSLEARF